MPILVSIKLIGENNQPFYRFALLLQEILQAGLTEIYADIFSRSEKATPKILVYIEKASNGRVDDLPDILVAQTIPAGSSPLSLYHQDDLQGHLVTLVKNAIGIRVRTASTSRSMPSVMVWTQLTYAYSSTLLPTPETG